MKRKLKRFLEEQIVLAEQEHDDLLDENGLQSASELLWLNSEIEAYKKVLMWLQATERTQKYSPTESDYWEVTGKEFE